MADLLYLTQRIPYPPTKGEKIRQWQIVQHLCRSHTVHLGCLVDDPDDWQHVPVVEALCATSHFAPLDRRRAKIDCLTGLLTGEALSVTFYRRPDLQRWVARTLATVRPEIVFVSSSNMAPYVMSAGRPAPRFIVDLVDVDSEKWRAYAQTGRPPMSWVHAREAAKTSELEGLIAARSDWCTLVSDDEARLFTMLQPQHASKAKAISNGVDHDFFDPARPFEAPFDTSRLNYVFTGTMDYPPNIEGAGWFARSILPLIRMQQPLAQFHIVGANPADEVVALASQDGVFVTGRVPDVRPYVAHATAAVAPMKIARGIQNKVLEAMAMARPVILTSAALEGIRAIPGQEIIVANDTASFAEACVTAGGLQTGSAARRRVIADYTWSTLLAQFDPLLRPDAGP